MGLEDIGQLIGNEIRRIVPQAVQEILSPVQMLSGFPDVLTVEEVAQVIRETDEKKIYDYCERNELPHLHLGRNLRFPKALLIKYLLNEEFNKCETCAGRKRKGKKLSEEIETVGQPANFNEKILRFATG